MATDKSDKTDKPKRRRRALNPGIDLPPVVIGAVSDYFGVKKLKALTPDQQYKLQIEAADFARAAATIVAGDG